jgi:hypothetical protein
MHQCLMFLHEFGSVLETLKAQELLTPKVCDGLDALRGRGVFYTEKQIQDSLESA